MARATSPFQTQDYGQPAAGEWQELRSELVALLDQVEGQVRRSSRPDPAYDTLTERMRDLRHQVTEVTPPPENRHREALKQVQRAIDRFSERDEAPMPANPRDTLEAAIQQIRSRHFTPEAPPAAAPRFSEMADSVGAITSRLERLEDELKTQARGQTANVKEIADQVGQLSHVVELLAGAVGEAGQVKRLETHIAGLAKLMADGPRLDMAALNQRLDDVAMTVGKLAELQKHYADRVENSGLGARLDDVTATVERLAELQSQVAAKTDTGALNDRLDTVTATVGRLAELQVRIADRTDTSALAQRLDDVTATVGRLADLQVQVADRIDTPKDGVIEAMKAIEDGVRNIYDRVDALERTMTVPPGEIEKITAELARLAEVMRSPQQPQGLVELIDALNVRISDIEGRSPELGELKIDMEALRNVVVGAMEPRFVALERQIGELSDRVESRGEVNIGELEAQVRALVGKMDQTGEQLSGLASLYSQPAGPAPDYEQLAELVASKASARMAGPGKGLDEAGLDAIEMRLGKVMKAAAATRPEPSAEALALQATIREVNDRLARLESSLRDRPAEAAAPAPMPLFDAPAMPETAHIVGDDDDPFAPIIGKLAFDEEPEAPVPVAAEPGDAMPKSPVEDAPLVDTPFADPNPLRTALEAKNGPRKVHPGLAREPEPDVADGPPEAKPVAPAPPIFDPSQVEPPPAPHSSLEMAEDDVFSMSGSAGPAPEVATGEEPRGPSINAFIAAQRRSFQKTESKPAAANPNSLMARAFARFQASQGNAPAKSEPPAPVPPPPVVEPEAKATRPIKAKPVKPPKVKPVKEKKPRGARLLAGDKQPEARWSPDESEPRVLPPAPEPSFVALGAEETTAPLDGDGPRRKPEPFLIRHRQQIILVVGVVVLSCLLYSMFGNRTQQKPQPVETTLPDAPPADVGDAALDPQPIGEQGFDTNAAAGAPRVIGGVDPMATGSIDGGPAQKFVPALNLPKLPQAFEAADAVANADPGATEVASLAGDTPAALESPVQVDMPPEGVGPEALRKAAAAGDARAQFEVAAIYTEGRAVPEDLKTAAVWYERAAGQGFAPAQYRLGSLYENGKGVDKDLDQARLWYQQAAEAGNRMAMHNLAALYASGSLGTQQFDAAAKWFEEAASRGMKDSQFNLGMLYARGLGVKQDLKASYKWFALAAMKGDKDAAKARDDIAASLDASTVQQLNAAVSHFKPAAIDFVANFAPIGTWAKDFDPGEAIDKVEVVKGVQLALMQLGFDVGTPDGIAGPKTGDAIRSFERSTGMSESGAINPRLLAVLGSQPV